ncbi:conserved hypothetical protein [Candidatus Nitrospira nitrificans]|uniref:Uncharacterized protein n=1 Tax=Candidatus Nitrospira nitrificans TaxID=1742973 RepID=A0A0S4L9G0_9BACT|nr:conserved hypothetical protein [Candidatus Nitrospira nitrificans]
MGENKLRLAKTLGAHQLAPVRGRDAQLFFASRTSLRPCKIVVNILLIYE